MLDQQIDGRMIFLHLKIISDSTHILPNSSSCIDLIFTNQPNLVTESGVHPSLHPKCRHQIVFAKLNLKVQYPPLYERLIWDFADIASMQILHQLIA